MSSSPSLPPLLVMQYEHGSGEHGSGDTGQIVLGYATLLVPLCLHFGAIETDKEN